jgi:hypothetical protein
VTDENVGIDGGVGEKFCAMIVGSSIDDAYNKMVTNH